MATSEELRAALAVAELEEQLIAAKAQLADEAELRAQIIHHQLVEATTPEDVQRFLGELAEACRPAPVSEELKVEVREARRVFRKMRAGYPPGPGEVRPDVVETGTGVN